MPFRSSLSRALICFSGLALLSSCSSLSSSLRAQKSPAESCRQNQSDRKVASLLSCSQILVDRVGHGRDAPTWRNERLDFLSKYISPEGNKGAVAVTMSDYNPEYHGWTWVRDGALIMREVERQWLETTSATERQALRIKINDYIQFSKRTQDRVGRDRLGEPRFDFGGNAYTGAWGRPQTDGPALRTLTLLPIANKLVRSKDPGDQRLLRDLYAAEAPGATTSVIKRDLEYMSNHYRDKSFDLWEEKKGNHFYNLLAQRTALVEGARLAKALRDPAAAQHYEEIAREITGILESFWEPSQNALIAARNVEAWRGIGATNLDIAVILGVNHAGRKGQSFSVLDGRVMATAVKIEQIFSGLYEINRIAEDSHGQKLAPAIGRYAEDVYNGHPNEAQRFTEGHPWVLATHAMGEYYFKVATELARGPNFEMTSMNQIFVQSLLPGGENITLGTLQKSNPLYQRLIDASFEKGISFWARVNLHILPGQSYPEMIHRVTGQAQSIPSLAWSDASSLSLLSAFDEARTATGKSTKLPGY